MGEVKTVIHVPLSKSVLVVEDNEDRIEWFRRKLANHDVTFAQTPQKAINVLGTHRFDIVFLDHDAVPTMVDITDPDYDRKTFWRVAEMLSNTGFAGTVIVHSHNPVGGQRMVYQLSRNANVHKLPFGLFDIEE